MVLWKHLFKNIAFISMAIFFVSGIVLGVKAYDFLTNGELEDAIERNTQCNIEFKEFKYSGPCDRNVMETLVLYGEAEFGLEIFKICKGEKECIKNLNNL